MLKAIHTHKTRCSLGYISEAEHPSSRTTNFMPSSQINSKFQFLYELIRTNLSYNFQMFHYGICKNYQRTLSMIRYLAEAENPTLIVRTLLRSKSYSAKLIGVIFSVWKCQDTQVHDASERRMHHRVASAIHGSE